jgi:hypothetical protein
MKDLLTAGRAFTCAFRPLTYFLLIGLVTSAILLAGCSDNPVAPNAAQEDALSTAATAQKGERGSWNNWHVHDLDYGEAPYTDENGLRHEDYNLFPMIWSDYPSEESPVVYCMDGAEKFLIGGDGGSKLAAGTCRNELYIIQIQLNDDDAPAPAGWPSLDLGDLGTFYYRLTPR